MTTPSKVVLNHAENDTSASPDLEYNSLRHAEPMKADERVGDVVTTSQVENEPCCGILD